MLELKIYNENIMGTDYFVGDIHGAREKFLAELEDRNFDYNKDRVFCVGDMIDRGPDSEGVLDLLATDWFYSVLGNHEDFLLGDSGHPDSIWYTNGGQWAFDDIMNRRPEIREYAKLIRKRCPLAIEVAAHGKRIGVIHTDPPAVWPSFYARENHLWGRSQVRKRNPAPVQGIDKVVFGHTPSLQCYSYANTINLDTGGTFADGHFTIMTALEVLEFNNPKPT